MVFGYVTIYPPRAPPSFSASKDGEQVEVEVEVEVQVEALY